MSSSEGPAAPPPLDRRRLLAGGLGLLAGGLTWRGPFVSRAAAQTAPFQLRMDGKAALLLVQDRPLVAAPPEHLLDFPVTPTDRLFIRNNGNIPDPAPEPDRWLLTVDGAVEQPLRLSLGELRQRFETVTLKLQLEGAGNGRMHFVPETRGPQLGHGAISCAAWTGVRLRDVLAAARPTAQARFTAHSGADQPLAGDAARPPFSRGMPLAKALEEHTLLAFAVNGEPLPAAHGAPLRLVVPGWPASFSQKWLTRIQLRERALDGPYMTGNAFRLPAVPIVPGARTEELATVAIESMPVRAILTSIADRSELLPGTRRLPLGGSAWAGERTVRAVHVSIDYGRRWQAMTLEKPANKYAWVRWGGSITLPAHGYHEIWVRATDSAGEMQPHAAGPWNPNGYLGNAIQRVAVLVKS